MDSYPRPFRVLIVDDAPAVREALRWALEDERDLAVIGEASDGFEAVDRVAELAPDVAIVDIELPGVDGYAVAQHVKALPHPPRVVFLSVHSDPASRQRGFEAGGDGFADKGIGWPAFIAEVRQVLGGHEEWH